MAAAVPTLRDFSESGEFRYELHLEDADERTNRFPSLYVFNVLENAAPALKFEAPAGDIEVSAIEEMRLQGVVRDDFGLADAGIGYQLAGEEPQYVSLAADGLSTNKLAVAHVLRMEDLGVEVGQVVSYFLWADDRDRDGELRRGYSDLFFATVRPFEEIFRQNRSATEGMREQQQQGEGGEQGGEQQQSIANLLDSQKDIISATWNIKRRDRPRRETGRGYTGRGRFSGRVTRHARAGVGAVAGLRVRRPGVSGQRGNAGRRRQPRPRPKTPAAKRLAKHSPTRSSTSRLPCSICRNCARTSFVCLASKLSQQRQQQQGRGNSNRAQRQLDQLEMQDTRNNYELESKAERQQTTGPAAGRACRATLQTLNRLKELARRQSDLNKRLQELQIALLDAGDEAERERIERELKRLQDEQRNLIDDLDEVQQRMDRSQDDELAESRQQLEEAREQMEQTARNLEQQQLSQAANSGSRASRNLDEVEEDYKEQTANKFADAMREMRQDARELDNTQSELNKAIEEDRQKTFRSLSDEGDVKEALDMAESQKGQLDELLQQMEQVSREAEDSEKLLSQELEDGVRRARQDNMEESLDQLSLLMRNNLPNETSDIQRGLTENISELRDTVENAAEKIIGSDEDAMRFAADRLDELREEVEREMELAQNEGQGQQPGRQREQQGDEQNPLGQGQRQQDSENQQQRGRGQGQPNEEQEENQQRQGRGQAGEEQQGQPGQGQGQPSEEQEENQQRQGRGQAGEEQQGQPGQGQRPGDQENPQTAQGRDGQPGGPNDQPNRRPDGNRDTGGSSGGSDLFRNLDDLDFDGPLTGLDFRDWEDRLREVEEVIEIPELRNQVSEVRQSARDIRRENKENGKPPKWDLVDMQILRPMTEINKRLEEELSLRQPKRELIPVDHEPVPAQYSELVRRYYERLGGRKEKNDTRN